MENPEANVRAGESIDVDALRELVRKQRAEIDSQMADLKVDTVDRIDRKVGTLGVIGLAAIAALVVFADSRINRELDRRLSTDAVDELIERELRKPVSEVEERVRRLDRREEIYARLHEAIGDDRGESFTKLHGMEVDDQRLETTIRFANALVQSYFDSQIWTYNTTSLEGAQPGRDGLIRHLAAAKDKWQRAKAAAKLAGEHDIRSPEVGKALFRAMRSDESATVRYYAWRAVHIQLQEELDAAALSPASQQSLERFYLEKVLREEKK